MSIKMQNRLLILSAIVVLAPSAAFAGGRPSDTAVTEYVRTALQEDPRVDASRITVSVLDGIVTLSGEVGNLASKNFADLEAKKINGVRGVVNELTATPAYRTDSEIARDIKWRVLGASSVSPRNLEVDVLEGVANLHGTVSSWAEYEQATLLATEVRGVRKVNNDIHVEYRTQRPDGEIRSDILAAIRRDVYLTGLPVFVTVRESVVTLTGSVGNAYEKQRAESDARWINGVKSAKNELKVEWWEDRGVRQQLPLPSDMELKEAVRDELYKDLRVEDPFEITVDSSFGHVTLNGTVESYHDRVLAESDANDVVGVARVTNNLIAKPARCEDSAVKKDVQSKLASDYLLSGQEIQVKVHDGIVDLSGNVANHFERKHALVATASVPGVVDVVNMLHVSKPVPSDTEIAQQIRRSLSSEDATRWVRDRIHVSVHDGIATLSGDVYTWSERRHADRTALRSRGVNAVDNRLTVEGVSYTWDEWHTKVAHATEYEFDMLPYE